MNSRYICFTLGAIVLIAAATAEVPPSISSEVQSPAAIWEIANDEIMLQQKAGKSDSACGDLADDVKSEVRAACAIAQKMVDKIKKGQHCCTKDASYVTSARIARDGLKQKAIDCKSDLKEAKNADVDFGKVKFNTVTAQRKQGKCNSFYGGAAYKAAKLLVDNLVTKCSGLDGSYAAAKNAAKAAVKQQDKARRDCRNATKKNADDTLKESSKLCSGDAKNIKSWTQAAHMMCILQKKTLVDCKVPPLPQLTKAKLNLAICKGEVDVVGNELRAKAAAKAKAERERRELAAKKEVRTKAERAEKVRAQAERNAKAVAERAAKAARQKIIDDAQNQYVGATITFRGSRHGYNRYYCSDANPVRCNRNGVGAWEKFKVVDAGGGKVALRSGRTNQYCADEYNRIICNRNAIGSWEKFTISGSNYIKGGHANRWCADEETAGSIKCNRNGIGQWETFYIGNLGGNVRRRTRL